MSKTAWTKEQRAAIDLRGSLLVAAAAGSGKTAVLVERVISRITDPWEPVDVDRLLVVTFTKAAANEMRERIAKALDEAVFREQQPGDVARLLRQIALLPKANIMTLHSFCLEIIRQYFFRLELDPSFRVADEAESELLRLDVLEALFEKLYELEAPPFLNLVDGLGSDRDDSSLIAYVLSLYKFAWSQVWPEEWLQKLSHAYQWTDVDSLLRSPWGQSVSQGIADKLAAAGVLLERAIQIAEEPGGPVHYIPVMQEDLERIKSVIRALAEGNWAFPEQVFQTWQFTELPRGQSGKKKKNTAAGEIGVDAAWQKAQKAESKSFRDEAKKIILKLKNEIFIWPFAEQIPALAQMGEMISSLAGLVLDFAQDYTTAKGKRNVADFTDLEHMALKLLTDEGEPSDIALSLQARFGEVLVDEYQDINPVQERILQLVTPKANGVSQIFRVGDVKQSIYRFRMADPTLFLGKYNLYPHWNSESEDSMPIPVPGLVVDLARNFRSRREVVTGVNFLFRQIMTEGAGEIAYDDLAALQYGASYLSGQEEPRTGEGPIEVHLFDPKELRAESGNGELSSPVSLDPEDNNEEPIGEDREQYSSADGEEGAAPEELEAARIEARLVGLRIRRLVEGTPEKSGPEFQVFDQKIDGFRPLTYSDIVILMRSYSSVAPVYLEELKNLGIPVYGETNTGYFGAAEVETVLSLLKVIDNPHQDIPLAAVFRSPIVGLNGTELGKLRILLPQSEFYEACSLAVWAGLTSENSAWPESENQEIQEEILEILSIYSEELPRLIPKAKGILASAGELETKMISFWLKLRNWRSLARRKSLADLLGLIYAETGYLAYVGTLPAGVQRQANLRVLYERARRFEATHYRGLFRFLRFLEKFREQGQDMGNARALGESENVLRLLTVHASKGLEFPVVFMVGLGHSFNQKSLRGKLLLHSRLGAGIPVIDVENSVAYPSFIQSAVKEQLAKEALAEELRILYVALTRAKERLFLFGGVKGLDRAVAGWQRAAAWEGISFSDAQLRSARCFLDWLGPALIRHPGALFADFSELTANREEPLNNSVVNEESKWLVFCHQNLPPIDTILPTLESDHLAAPNQGSVDYDEPESWYREVDARLSWKYPFSSEVWQIAKTSVSEVKRRFNWYMDEETEKQTLNVADISQLKNLVVQAPLMKRPQFLQTAPRQLTGSERGIALHTLMQHLPFQDWGTDWQTLQDNDQLRRVTNLIESLILREIIAAEPAASLNIRQVVQFLNSSLGMRLFHGNTIMREVPFTLSINPAGLEHPVLLQGVIDTILLTEHGSVEIIDYKTDFLGTEITDPERELKKRYAVQLAFYALAAERLLKVNIECGTIYAFSLGLEVEFGPEELKHILKSTDLV